MIAEIVAGAVGVAAGGAVVWWWRRASRTPAAPARTDLRPVLDAMQLGVTVTDTSGHIVYSNPADAAMHGFASEELIGQPGSIFAPPTARKTVTTGELPSLKSWRREGINRRKDGSVFPVRLRTDMVRDPEQRVQGFVTVCEDVTGERRERDAQLAGMLHDPLTGLASRTFLIELVSRAMRRTERHGDYHFAVLWWTSSGSS
jgi:PAS domain S-box-containing protein